MSAAPRRWRQRCSSSRPAAARQRAACPLLCEGARKPVSCPSAKQAQAPAPPPPRRHRPSRIRPSRRRRHLRAVRPRRARTRAPPRQWRSSRYASSAGYERLALVHALVAIDSLKPVALSARTSVSPRAATRSARCAALHWLGGSARAARLQRGRTRAPPPRRWQTAQVASSASPEQLAPVPRDAVTPLKPVTLFERGVSPSLAAARSARSAASSADSGSRRAAWLPRGRTQAPPPQRLQMPK